ILKERNSSLDIPLATNRLRVSEVRKRFSFGAQLTIKVFHDVRNAPFCGLASAMAELDVGGPPSCLNIARASAQEWVAKRDSERRRLRCEHGVDDGQHRCAELFSRHLLGSGSQAQCGCHCAIKIASGQL